MPQSKRPRKKYKPKPITSVKPRKIMTTDEQIKQLYGDKLPYCKICETKCVRATDEEVLDYKKYDTTYQFDFIFAPSCDCWETNVDWMEA